MTAQDFYLYGTIGLINCTAAAYPRPEFEWTFQPCLTGDCSTEAVSFYFVILFVMRNIVPFYNPLCLFEL